jgi:RNA polymerase sigma-70 factor, ECF subfamily
MTKEGMNPKYSPLERIGRDPDALEAFYRDHIDAVQRFVAKRTADPQVAADLTADIFVAALDSAHRYDPGAGPVLAWLYGVGRNVLASEVRRGAREMRTARRVHGRRLLEDSGLARIEEQLDAEHHARHVFRAIAQLPDNDRRLLELVALDGLSVNEAAQVLGVKPATARVRLHRSRTRLTALLREADLADPSPVQGSTGPVLARRPQEVTS